MWLTRAVGQCVFIKIKRMKTLRFCLLRPCFSAKSFRQENMLPIARVDIRLQEQVLSIWYPWPSVINWQVAKISVSVS